MFNLIFIPNIFQDGRGGCYGRPNNNQKLTFKATRIACVLDFRPKEAEPCFTASIAYSIWCILPWKYSLAIVLIVKFTNPDNPTSQWAFRNYIILHHKLRLKNTKGWKAVFFCFPMLQQNSCSGHVINSLVSANMIPFYSEEHKRNRPVTQDN